MDFWLAERMSKLGTETAFEVGYYASLLKLRGLEHKVIPFYVGNINLKTPKNIRDAIHKAIEEGKTGYCAPKGIYELRKAMAEHLNERFENSGLEFTEDNVSVQSGGKPVIIKTLLTLMNPGDAVVYPEPGYTIYSSAINVFDGIPVPYKYVETEKGWEIDLDHLKYQVNKYKPKILIFNNHHNPTGSVASQKQLDEIAELAVQNNLLILNDEAYERIYYGQEYGSLLSDPRLKKRMINAFSWSKSFAMPGLRLGTAVGPEIIIDGINKWNVNIESCTTQPIQWGGIEALKGPQDGARKILSSFRKRRDFAYPLINKIPGFKTHLPKSTFYFWVDVTEAMQNKGITDYEKLWRSLIDETGVAITTRNHFGNPLECETRKYIRISFSGVSLGEIKEGLKRLEDYFSR